MIQGLLYCTLRACLSTSLEGHLASAIRAPVHYAFWNWQSFQRRPDQHVRAGIMLMLFVAVYVLALTFSSFVLQERMGAAKNAERARRCSDAAVRHP